MIGVDPLVVSPDATRYHTASIIPIKALSRTRLYIEPYGNTYKKSILRKRVLPIKSDKKYLKGVISKSRNLNSELRLLDVNSCQELVAEMVHTKEGSRAVREFLACGTAKDRKQIIKVLKPHIERMCKDDEAQLVLFTALDVVE